MRRYIYQREKVNPFIPSKLIYKQLGPEVIILFSLLKLTKHEILNAHKCKNIEKFSFFSDSDRSRMLFFHNNCWHFNIYEQEKFQAQLS